MIPSGMSIVFRTRDSVFELTEPGDGTLRVEVIEDLVPGKKGQRQEGTVYSGAWANSAPRMGLVFMLKKNKTDPDDKLIFKVFVQKAEPMGKKK